MRVVLVLAVTLAVALVLACGDGEEPELAPSTELSASDLVARAYEAMTEESFALDVPPEPSVPQPGQPPYSVKYAPPDLLLITGGGYEWPAYFFLVGKDVYASQVTGKRWELYPDKSLMGGHGLRLGYDPRELLRIATDVRDEGTHDLDGEPHRLVAVRQDAAKFAEEYLPGPKMMLNVEMPSACRDCTPPCPECVPAFDRQRLETFGYRNPDGEGVLLLKGQDIQIRVSRFPPKKDEVHFTVRGARELSPALREEFRQVLEAYGADPSLLDAAEVQVFDRREQWLASDEADSWRSVDVRFWVDPKTFLVTKMETGPAGRSPAESLNFINYGKVELPKPEPAMLTNEVDFFFGEVQHRWGPLSTALEANAQSHGGLYPDELTPAVLQEALESEGLSWPQNAFTGESMIDTEVQNPGDFHYRPTPDRHCYHAEVYDWEGASIPVYPPGPEGWMKCPEAETPSP